MCWSFDPEMPLAKYEEVMMNGFYLVDELKYGMKPGFDERSAEYAQKNWHHLVVMLNMMLNNNETTVRESGRMVPAVPPREGLKATIVDVWKIYNKYKQYVVDDKTAVMIGDSGFISDVTDRSVTIKVLATGGNIVEMDVDRDDFHLIFCVW